MIFLHDLNMQRVRSTGLAYFWIGIHEVITKNAHKRFLKLQECTDRLDFICEPKFSENVFLPKYSRKEAHSFRLIKKLGLGEL